MDIEPRLGIDFGRVIHGGLLAPGDDDTAFLDGSFEEALASPATEGVYEVLPGLIASEEAFRPEMWDDLLTEPLERDDAGRVREALVAEARRAFNDKGFGAVSVAEVHTRWTELAVS